MRVAPRRAHLWALAATLALLTFISPLGAQAPHVEPVEGKKSDERIQVLALPLLGDASITPGGWTELLVRIENRGTENAEGTVTVFASGAAWTTGTGVEVRAPYSVGAGATVSLRMPFRVGWNMDPVVRVLAADGKKLFEQNFHRTGDNRTLLVDVARASPLGVALRGIPVGSRADPWLIGYGGYSGSGSPTVTEVASPMYDPVTGDAQLPRHTAGYARVAAVLLRSDELARLPAAELEALSGFVLGGGTLAVILVRPEDMRHPTVTALVGGDVERASAPIELLKELYLVPMSGGGGYYPGGKTQPVQSSPEPLVAETLTGYRGGNLQPSPYGASAPYGLGEVHFLGFNPQERPAVDSPWVHIRMVDMLRRANERNVTALYRHGGPHTIASEVRRQLDPNEGARWAIVVTALLLCAYAVFAGPVNFTYWRKKQRPLRAFLYVPVASALTFGAVVGIGVVAKGCSGRARHLTVVEAGAGMTRGTARRWRGFFVPSQQTIRVQTSSATSVLGTELMDHGEETSDHMLLDRDGLSLVDLPLLPWETVVVREDAYVDLGEGISLVKKPPDEIQIVNRTGRKLRGLLLSDPTRGPLFLRELEDGGSVSSASFDGASFILNASTPAGLSLHDFDVYSVSMRLNEAVPGLGEAWTAVLATITQQKDWFPDGVPVLLAQIEGGEGRTRDTGLNLDSDRLLVRIVGYGGTP
jgi:hypothetical protein